MRRPCAALNKVSGARDAGARLRAALLPLVQSTEGLWSFIEAHLSDQSGPKPPPPVGLEPSHLGEARRACLRALGSSE
eukprot:5812816-Lingulodinium_polyedra.AAC.1